MATVALSHPPRWKRHVAPGYLVSPAADIVLLIGSPLIALAVTGLAWCFRSESVPTDRSLDASALGTALATLIGAHLAVTFVHTHGNVDVFRRHPWRFTVVPVALLAALVAWPPLRVIGVVVAVIWDVHHSGMQSFGLARLYARRAGNDSQAGRTLDLMLNHALYAGPVLAGAGLLIHAGRMGKASPVALALLARLEPWTLPLRVTLVTMGVAVVVAHVVGHWRLARRGVPVSPQAVALLASTAITSVVSWGFNPFGVALFTMKLFHCVQYFTLVAVVEKAQVTRWLDRPKDWVPLPLVAVLLLVPALAYGAWARHGQALGSGLASSLVLTVTLLHFWYDGFTWSASRART